MKKEFFHHKYRFDTGYQFLTFINFFLLNVTAAEQLKKWTHIPNTKVLLLVVIPTSLLAVYLFGWFLDHFKYWQGYNTAANDRNEQWRQTVEFYERTDKKLEKL
jgi:hypothetical protein